MPSSTLTSKGPITLPRKVREQLGLRPGDTVDFVIGPEGDNVVRAGSVDVSALRGSLHRPHRRAVSVERMQDAIRKGAGRR